MKNDTSLKDVEQTLQAADLGIIDIPLFMKNYLKGKKGGAIAASFYTEKSKNF